MRAVHLGVVELEGDGERGLQPASAVTAPCQEGIGVDAAVLIDDAVEFRASQCRRADYHGLIVKDVLTGLADGLCQMQVIKLSPPLILSTIMLMAMRSYLYSFPLCGNM